MLKGIGFGKEYEDIPMQCIPPGPSVNKLCLEKIPWSSKNIQGFWCWLLSSHRVEKSRKIERRDSLISKGGLQSVRCTTLWCAETALPVQDHDGRSYIVIAQYCLLQNGAADENV